MNNASFAISLTALTVAVVSGMIFHTRLNALEAEKTAVESAAPNARLDKLEAFMDGQMRLNEKTYRALETGAEVAELHNRQLKDLTDAITARLASVQ